MPSGKKKEKIKKNILKKVNRYFVKRFLNNYEFVIFPIRDILTTICSALQKKENLSDDTSEKARRAVIIQPHRGC